MKNNFSIYIEKIIKHTFFWYGVYLVCLFLLHFYFKISNDEGLTMAHAWNIFQGKKIYVDFFSFRPPLSFQIPAFLIHLFGPNYWIQKLFAILFLWLGTIGIEKTSRLFLPKPFSFLPAFLYIFSTANWAILNHNVFSLVVIIWALYFFLLAHQKKVFNYFSLAGLTNGIAWLFLQHRPSFLFLGLSFVLLLDLLFSKNKKYSARALVVFVCCFFLPLVVAALLIDPQTFFYHLIIFPTQNYLSINQVSFFSLHFFIFVLIILGGLTIKNKNLRPLLMVQIFLLGSNFSRTNIFYMSLVAFPIYIMFFSYLNERFSKFLFRQKTIINSGLLLLITLSTLQLIPIYQKKLFLQKHCQNIIKTINQNCQNSKHIYAGPFLPGLYFLTEKENPTRFNDLFTDMNTMTQFEEAKDDLANKKPFCAIVDYNNVANFNYDQDNPVDNYLKENYEISPQQNFDKLYIRKKIN